MKKYDFFISHASEDKDDFVRELADSLAKKGVNVWYDEFTLNVGDSIRRSIEQGINNSNAGLVVLSPKFFKKEWPNKELDSLIYLESKEKIKIYPIWLNVDADYISRYSLLLADKIAINATDDIHLIVEKLYKLLDNKKGLNKQEIELLYFDDNIEHQKFLTSRSIHNLAKINAYLTEKEFIYEKIKSEYKEDDLWNFEIDIEQELEEKTKHLTRKYEIPDGTWLEGELLNDDELDSLEEKLMLWCRGELSDFECYYLYYELDEIYNTDFLLILFSIPNAASNIDQYDMIENIVLIGSRHAGGKTKTLNQLYTEVTDLIYSEYDEHPKRA